MAKTINLKKCLPVLLIAAAMVVGVTGATVIHQLTMENPIKTPPVEGSIPEIITNEAKQVQFKNDGEADVFLRASYSESWTAEDGTILPNETMLADGTTGRVATPTIAGENKNWIKGKGDGWYYYKKVLPGEKSGQPDESRKTTFLINNVVFVNLAELPDSRYKDAEYQIHVVMEIVQASDEWPVSQDAVKEMFDGIMLTQPTGWSDSKYEAVIAWPSE